MAEAIAAFGTAAGAVQLVDVALRSSREVYEFLFALKNAKKDIQALKDALRDTELNIRSLRNYLETFAGPIEEHEVLPETITRSIMHFHDDLDTLKAILPVRLTPNLAQKVKWVYDRRKIRDVTKRLLDRKVELLVTLSIAGLLQDRKDATGIRPGAKLETGAIVQQQQICHATTTRHNRALSDPKGIHQSNHAQLHQQTQYNNEGVKAMQAALNQQQVQILDTLSSIQSRISHGLTQTQPELDNVNTSIVEMKQTAAFSASNTDMLTKIFRSELRSALVPMLEQTRTKSEIRNEEMFTRMENMVEHMSFELGRHATRNDVFRPKGTELTDTTHDGQNSGSDRLASPDEALQLNNRDEIDSCSPCRGPDRHDRAHFHERFSMSRCTWSFKWRFGSLQIDFQSTRHERRTSFAIYVHFRPSQTLFRLPGISMFYSSAPTQQGYYQIAPMISTFQIISKDDPAWDAIRKGDLHRLQEMFAQKLVSPKSQDDKGVSLLHCAAFSGMYQICETILSIGGMVDQYDESGLTPILFAAISALLCFTKIWSLEKSDFAKPSRKVDYVKTFQLLKGREMSEDTLFFDVTQWARVDLLDNDWGIATNVNYEQLLGSATFVASTYRVNTWRLLFWLWPKSLMRPTREALDAIQFSLQKGLDPNMRAGEHDRPLLALALDYMTRQKDEVKTKNDSVKAAGDGTNDQCIRDLLQLTSGDEVQNEGIKAEEAQDMEDAKSAACQSWCIVEAFIKGGADIYFMEPDTIESARHWNDIWTFTDYAMSWEVGEEWGKALRECGLDPGEVYLEDMQRRKQAVRLRGATRTGFDEESLALPSTVGLRCRVCSHKSCKHGSE